MKPKPGLGEAQKKTLRKILQFLYTHRKKQFIDLDELATFVSIRKRELISFLRKHKESGLYLLEDWGDVIRVGSSVQGELMIEIGASFT